ncbi:MAG: gfo/Idh/MocA family oxidoreductase [Planctomycetes bacterium]|nr:gfo/Idh/MocA family oxidoreductase [Planctomycetota bacterium]
MAGRIGSRAASVGIALVGTGFMGRAHANAWRQAPCFFDLARRPQLAVVAGRRGPVTRAFAQRWQVARSLTDWTAAVRDPAVHLVDVLTPNHLHAPVAVAALRAGKHVACEKPLAGTLDDARVMRDAAGKAKGRTFVWFNYRRCPAVGLMRQLVHEGRLGEIRQVRARYLQDWGGAATPMAWRFDAKLAGSGAHGDLNAHLVDLVRFTTGLEIDEVCGAIEATFVGRRRSARGRQASTVDDAMLFLARLANGATASFEASRVATGNQNANGVELNGTKGSVRFDFERMNELEWWDHTLPARLRGWSRIMCTDASHPWVGAYWPAAHLIGYEHGFISMAADIVRVITGQKPLLPLPDFQDAFRTQCVLEAATRSARTGGWVRPDSLA